MKRIFLPFAVMFSVMFLFASCLESDDDSTTYPSDAAITAFTLGTVNCYTTTTSSTGADSLIKTTVTGSSYVFYIDQMTRTIYNPDSLPYGCDVKHLVCTITSKNSGSVVLKSMTSDSLRYYSSTDSLDFSVPRTISVYSLDASNHVDYTVTVNVKKSNKDYILWHQLGTVKDFADAKGMKAVTLGDSIYMFASYGSTGAIFVTDMNDGANWKLLQWNLNMPIPANAYKNVVTNGGYIYLYTSGQILRSLNGMDWEQTGMAELSQLVAASASKLYALDEGMNLISTEDEGKTWRNESLDSDKSLMPTRDMSYCCMQSFMDYNIENLVILGNRDVDAYPSDNQAYVWNKVEDNSETPYNHSWMFVTPFDAPGYELPRLNNLTAVAYDEGIIAVGGSGLGACSTGAFDKIYLSTDHGIYWTESGNCYLPSDFSSTDVFAMTVDSDYYLWIISGGNGQVWRSRLGSGIGTSYQYVFTE